MKHWGFVNSLLKLEDYDDKNGKCFQHVVIPKCFKDALSTTKHEYCVFYGTEKGCFQFTNFDNTTYSYWSRKKKIITYKVLFKLFVKEIYLYCPGFSKDIEVILRLGNSTMNPILHYLGNNVYKFNILPFFTNVVKYDFEFLVEIYIDIKEKEPLENLHLPIDIKYFINNYLDPPDIELCCFFHDIIDVIEPRYLSQDIHYYH
jgi:hypothetical protein